MSIEKQKTSRFTLLWLKAQPMLAGYVGSLVRDRAAADDIVQSVALTAVEKMDDFDEQRSFEAWVVGIARYKVLQHYRSTGQDRLVFDAELVDRFTNHYTEIATGYEDRLAALRTCMQKLPSEANALLGRRYFDREAVTSIAESLDQPPQKISKRLFTIRRALERCIQQRLGMDGGER